MYRLVYKNKKGVSLIELMTVLVVLGLILPLAGQILYNLTKLNNTAIDRWDVQSAVQLTCREFETSADSLTNAYQVDILYDPVIDSGVLLNDDYSITWIEGATMTGNGNATFVVPKELTDEEPIEGDDPFTYIFSAPTWRNEGGQKGEYLGELLYMRNYMSRRSRLVLKSYGLENIPVKMRFSMGTTEKVQSSSGKKYTDENIIIRFQTGRDDIVHYEIDTAFTIINNTRSINIMNDKLVMEANWVYQGSVVAYPVGWDNETLNSIDADIANRPQPTVESNDTFYSTTYIASDGTKADTIIPVSVENNVTTDPLQKAGNVLRYKSPLAEKAQSSPEEHSTGANVATCFSEHMLSGSKVGERVLDSLRLFRDNVLQGTEFGDWFIHQYYYVWSPFLIEHTAFLKPVYQMVLIPVSYVCEFIAKL